MELIIFVLAALLFLYGITLVYMGALQIINVLLGLPVKSMRLGQYFREALNYDKKILKNIGKFLKPDKSSKLVVQSDFPDDTILSEYTDFGTHVMLLCIMDNYLECELSKPGGLPKHMPPLEECVVNHPVFGTVYQYDFGRKSGIAGNIHDGFHFVYSPIKTGDIKKKLNNCFSNYSINAGYGTASIKEIIELDSGRIRLVIGR
ncbi:hypothetical protein AALA80_00050 [Oscillospiraceae bacterium 50-60]